MIFDIILIIMVITALTRSSSKGCTEDMNFAIGFLVVVRIAGAAYSPLSKIVSKFVEGPNLPVYISYIASLFIVFFIYNTIVGTRIIDIGSKIPKTTGRVLTLTFSIFRVMIIYSVIFTFLYAFPVLHRIPAKLIEPKTEKLAYGILGKGTNDVFDNFAVYLGRLNNPIKFLEKQKYKQESSAAKKREAIKEHEGLESFVTPEEKEEKKDE
ncbi:MAG: CvpA family protein [Candidatus Delongbacteria bacterium]|nr:CvpA family protein [Candidatus Delongbacteria bacterium]